METTKKDFLDELAQGMMVVMIIAATVLTLLAVVLQFVSPEAKTLVSQLSYYAYGWMVFFALGPAVKRFAFMRIALLVDKYPESVKRGLSVAYEVVLFIMMAILCWFSIQNLLNSIAAGDKNAAAPVIPLALAYAAPVVGYALGVIAYVVKFLNAKKGGAKA